MILENYEIAKGINVYRGLFENVNETYKFIKESENKNESLFGPWEDWYVFGKIQRSPNIDTVKSDYAKKIINEKFMRSGLFPDVAAREIIIYEEIMKIVNMTFSHHVEKYGYKELVDQYEWQISGPSVCKYEPTDKGPHEDPNHALTYHTDYQNEFTGQPGLKSGFTITVYFNDDFDGGDIDFYTGEEVIRYKPKAGDVIIFPSGSPDIDPSNIYLHASHIVKDNAKYFARYFAVYYKEADQEYLDGIKEYGEEVYLDMLSKKAQDVRASFYSLNAPSLDTPIRIFED